jgi:hypothetical protein
MFHRLYTDVRTPSPALEVFGWGLLTLMVGLATVFLLALQSWSRCDAAAFEQIRRELEEG